LNFFSTIENVGLWKGINYRKVYNEKFWFKTIVGKTIFPLEFFFSSVKFPSENLVFFHQYWKGQFVLLTNPKYVKKNYNKNSDTKINKKLKTKEKLVNGKPKNDKNWAKVSGWKLKKKNFSFI
jgi:hypothetical protein